MARTYLELFDVINYDGKDIKNLYTQIEFDVDYLEREKLIDYYRIKDGETPDRVAEYFYNDKRLYWLILKLNDMRDYFYGWPLSDKELKEYMDEYYTEKDDEITELAEELSESGADIDIKKNEIKDELYQNFYTENDTKKLIKVLKGKYLDSLMKQV